MAQEYQKRIDGAVRGARGRADALEASDNIHKLVGQFVVSIGADGKVDLWLEGDLAGILSLASAQKHPLIWG